MPKKHQKGSIKRIHCFQFLTYQDVEILAGPRLNIVVGPNGTGKSSIVCAIAIGLGTTPRVVGRSDKLGEYVKQGCDDGWVEVELESPQFPCVIRRFLKKGEDTRSTYTLNGNQATQKKITEVVKSFDIQIGNFCTFLPQEKVGEFSGFGPLDNLRETQRAVGGDEMLAQFKNLHETQAKMKNHESHEETVKKTIEDLTKQNERLEHDKQKMDERQKHLETVHVCRQKLKWFDFCAKQQEFKKAKETLAAVKQNWQEAQACLDPLKQKLDEVTFTETKNKKRQDALLNKLDKHKADQARFNAEADKKVTEADKTMREIQNIHLRQKARVAKREEAERKVAQAQQQKMPESEVQLLQQTIDELSPEILRVTSELEQKQDRLSELGPEMNRSKRAYAEATRRLDHICNIRQQKMRTIKDRLGKLGNEAEKFWQWLEKDDGLNRGSFKHTIHGPVALEVSVTDPEMSHVVESSIGNNILTAFVTECDADYRLVRTELKRLNCKNMVLNIEGGRMKKSTHNYQPQVLKALEEHGISKYVEDYIECTDAVRQGVRDHCNVDGIVIGNARTLASLKTRGPELNELLMNNASKQSVLCVPRLERNRVKGWDQHKTNRSRYQRDKTFASSRSIRDANVLGSSEDAEERARCEETVETERVAFRQAQAEVDSITTELQAVKDTVDDLKGRKRDAKAKLTFDLTLERKIRTLERRVTDMKAAEAHDVGKEQEVLTRKLTLYANQAIENVEKAQAEAERVMEATAAAVGARLSYEFVKDCSAATLRELNQSKAANLDLERQFEAEKRRYSNLKGPLKQLKIETEEFARLYDAAGNCTELAGRFAQLSGDLENLETRGELEAQMEDEQNSADAIHDNPAVIEKYQQRKIEISDHEKKLSQMRRTHEDIVKSFEPMKANWEGRIRALIKVVNGLFSEYMAALGNRGNVYILEDKSYDKWGLDIKICFRQDGEMQTLHKNFHSGGERSVATIMFLMALQDSVISPFRVVDEINQGMDEPNERQVFKRIVENSIDKPNGPLRPQYFLITPKLLQGLTAMEKEDVTVHFVMNGPYNIKDYRDWNIPRFIKKRKELNSGAAGSSKQRRLS